MTGHRHELRRRHSTTQGGFPISRPDTITVVGGGVIGLWQALTLAQKFGARTFGRTVTRVRLVERSTVLFADAASRLAGAMLAPYCEAEAAPSIVIDLGLEGLARWREVLPDLITQRGTLVVAPPRDRGDLLRFAKVTRGHTTIYAQAIGGLEPELADRFPAALSIADEAHMDPRAALPALARLAELAGCRIECGHDWSPAERTPGETVIDCRGLGARATLPNLRGVRGERAIVRAREVTLTRMVRLLHPRQPIYIVPWADHEFMIGATVIESDEAGPVTVRSALDLLGAAFAVHPGFAEAEILELAAGVRPTLPDNMPNIAIDGATLSVNGAYRHGFLLAPVLADAVLAYLEDGTRHPHLMRQSFTTHDGTSDETTGSTSHG